MFDRAAGERPRGIENLAAEARAGVLASDGNRFALHAGALHLVPPSDFDPSTLTFLGRRDGAPLFIAHAEPAGQEVLDFRRAAMTVDAADREILFFAKAMLHWIERTRFCGRCGSVLTARSAGYARICTNGECALEVFPRLDPAVIMLVTRGDEALLGRHHRYSVAWTTFAGFVEAGETIEQAAVRELREETGLDAQSLRYVHSQPWPMPSSLMLGFRVEADGALHVDPEELIEARWFRRGELRAGVAAGEVNVSPTLSIAGQLIAGWLDE